MIKESIKESQDNLFEHIKKMFNETKINQRNQSVSKVVRQTHGPISFADTVRNRSASAASKRGRSVSRNNGQSQPQRIVNNPQEKKNRGRREQPLLRFNPAVSTAQAFAVSPVETANRFIILSTLDTDADNFIVMNEIQGSSELANIAKIKSVVKRSNRCLAVEADSQADADRLKTEIMRKYPQGITITSPQLRKPQLKITGCADSAQFIMEQMKWSGRADAVFLDISKAFDRLSHTSIAIALAEIGMPIRQLLFVMKFLNQRQYFVRVNSSIATEAIFPDSGISQGSHIGPALFVLVANKIKQHIHASTKLYQYADDTLLVQSISSGSDEDALQTSIDGIADWASSTGLMVNASKTKLIKFSRGTRDTLTTYTCNGNIIPEDDHIRYLGVIFDYKMSFNKHAAEVRDRTTRFMYAAVRLCKFIKQPLMIQRIYKIYVEPIILYAAATWSTRTNKMTMIENSHRIATRTALCAPIRPHLPGYMMYADRCARLKSLTVPQRMTQFNVIVAKRFAEMKTFTENQEKIMTAINVPDPTRRVPLPLVNLACKRQHALTPIGFLLKNINTSNIDFENWTGTFNSLKRQLEQNVLLYA